MSFLNIIWTLLTRILIAYGSVLYRSIQYADDSLFALEMKIAFKIERNAWGVLRDFSSWKNRKVFTVVCSVLKQLGCGQSTQEVERNTQLKLIFLPTPLSCSSRFLRALQQNRAQSKPFRFVNDASHFFLLLDFQHIDIEVYSYNTRESWNVSLGYVCSRLGHGSGGRRWR